MVKKLIFFLLLLSPLWTFSQSKSINSLGSLYDSVNAVPTKEGTGINMKVSWMDSLIEIRRLIDTATVHRMIKTAGQNCHSYALQKYFQDQGITDTNLFTPTTILTENIYMQYILNTAFKKTNSYHVKRKKCKECVFKNQSIIIFRTEWNSLIHTAYYDGKFHSKYGAWAAKAEDKIESVIKVYWDTKIIEEYELDPEKIEEFLGRKKM
jgi:hypothetical protein